MLLGNPRALVLVRVSQTLNPADRAAAVSEGGVK